MTQPGGIAQIENIKGPRIEPWGTSEVIVALQEEISFNMQLSNKLKAAENVRQCEIRASNLFQAEYIHPISKLSAKNCQYQDQVS